MPDFTYGSNKGETTQLSEGDDFFDARDGNDTVYGNGGNDTIQGGGNSDKLFGGAGNDTFLRFQNGSTLSFERDSFDGGDGFDTLNVYSQASGTSTIDLAIGKLTSSYGTYATPLISIENLILIDAGMDLTVIGSDAANFIEAFVQQATVNGGGGNDAVSIWVNTSDVDGGSGTDTLIVGRNWEYQTSGPGFGISLAITDQFQPFSLSFGAVRVKNFENLSGSVLDDVFTGDGGNNVLAGAGGNDRLTGGAGDDTLAGDGGFAYTSGDAAALKFNAMESGARGSDVLEGGLGKDKLIGGPDSDTASYAHAAGSVTVNLSTGKASGADGADTLTGIENLIGSAFADVLTGSAGANDIDGGQGADAMAGGAGNDTYHIDNVADTASEAADGGIDTVISDFAFVLGDNIENLTLGGSAAISATGNALANTITGNAGVNRLYGGAGDDTYVVQNARDLAIEKSATGGHDTVRSSVDFQLGANVEDLVLTGTAEKGTGNALANTITGNDGANVIDGGRGADVMRGGLGNDTYYVESRGDQVIETNGWDRIYSSISITVPATVEEIYLTGAQALNATGDQSFQKLVGNGADNVLDDGGGGNDWLEGGLGNDTYRVHRGNTNIHESADAGIDTLYTDGGGSLSDNVENLISTSDKGWQLNGNALDNHITAGAGSNTLDGKAGADTMTGGGGNDTYWVDNAGDVAVELANGGRDSVTSAIDYTLGANVEVLWLQDTALKGTGNDAANEINGNRYANVIDGKGGADLMQGGEGADTYYVDNAADRIVETGVDVDQVFSSAAAYTLADGVEQLTLTGAAIKGTGNAGVNTITGNALANVIDGKGGADTLKGAAGDDTYILTDTVATVVELADQGTDTVRVIHDYALTDNVENLVLVRPDGAWENDFQYGYALTGNALANTITGNRGDDVIDGGAGADTMIGGGGNDTFFVDNAGDKVSGSGLIKASITYTVTDDFDLTLIGAAAIDGTGSAGANRLTGNDAANVLSGLGGNDRLDGGAGTDTLKGGDGDDLYIIDSTGDTVVETATGGVDGVLTTVSLTLAANIELAAARGTDAIALTGNSGENVLFGNEAANVLNGGDGDDFLIDLRGGKDTLQGGSGADWLWAGVDADTLTGGAGADRFYINQPIYGQATPTITDFVSGSDKLVVLNYAVTGTFLPDAFVQGTAARDANDFVIYDKASGNLWFDDDGNGVDAKVLVASFTPGTALAVGDIELMLGDVFYQQILPFSNMLEL